MPATYTAEQFAAPLGSRPEDWGLAATDLVTISDDSVISSDARFLGHLTDAEREFIEKAYAQKVREDLARINRYRQSIGFSALDPSTAGWTPHDVVVEAERIATLSNPDWSPGWVAGFAFGGRAFGGALATGLGRAVWGTDTDALAYLMASRVAGQIVGASGLAAVAAPDGMRARAALGAAAGAWVPYLGAPLAALGAYVATRPSGRASNPLSPRAKRWLVVGSAAVAALLVGGGVVYARSKLPTPEGPLEAEEAVDRAIDILGEDADVADIADAAYPMAYPDCPQILDPEDPTHEQCVEYWWHLHGLAKESLPEPGDEPSPGPEELAGEGPAADMRNWLESLSQSQRSQLRQILGPTHYDPIKRAAYDGEDGKTVAAVIRLKNDIQKLLSEDPIAAAKRYTELKSLLGPKLDELMDMAEEYKGDA